MDNKKSNALLLSGGMDSGFLASFLVNEIGISPKIYAGEVTVPSGFGMNKMDAIRSEKYTNKLKLNKQVIDINEDDVTFQNIDYLVRRMPFAAHTAYGFHVMMNRK